MGLAEMVGVLRAGRQHRCSLRFAIDAVEAMTSILRSGETRQPVNLSTVCGRPDPMGPEEAEELLRGEFA